MTRTTLQRRKNMHNFSCTNYVFFSFFFYTFKNLCTFNITFFFFWVLFYFRCPQWGKSPGLQVLLKLNSLSYILWSSTSPVEQCSSHTGSKQKLCRSQWKSGLHSPTWFQSHGQCPTLIILFFSFPFPFPFTKSHTSLKQWDRRDRWYQQHPSVVRDIKSRCESARTAPPIYRSPHAISHAEVSSSSCWVFGTCRFAGSFWGCCVALEHFC